MISVSINIITLHIGITNQLIAKLLFKDTFITHLNHTLQAITTWLAFSGTLFYRPWAQIIAEAATLEEIKITGAIETVFLRHALIVDPFESFYTKAGLKLYSFALENSRLLWTSVSTIVPKPP